MRTYRRLARPLLFRFGAERVHDLAVSAASFASKLRLAPVAGTAFRTLDDPRLAVEAAGIRFRNPLGLAAGFDKNGRAIPMWAAFGFGHVEIGSVSAFPSNGNPKPRLFRIPDDQGIVVNYGLPNEGAERVAQRLRRIDCPVPLGINLVNTNRGPGCGPEPDDRVIEDYVKSFGRLQPYAGYVVLNLSCPNTLGGRGFVSDSCRLRSLIDAIGALKPSKPVFLKVAPFPGVREMESFLEVVAAGDFVSGFAVNLPPGKPDGLRTSPELLQTMPGAVSGKPCEALANRTIAELYRRLDRRRHVIVGAGGVFEPEDAYMKIRLGATLVQLLTSLVYEGPGVVGRILDGLGELLGRDGFRNVAEAVGVDAIGN